MKIKSFLISLAVCLALALGLFGARHVLADTAAQNEADALQEVLCAILPGSTTFTQETYSGEDTSIRTVYKGESGLVVRVTTGGYAGDLTLLVGVRSDGSVSGLWVEDMNETQGLGSRVTYDVDFLAQMLNSTGDLAVATPEEHSNADSETSATSGATSGSTTTEGSETEVDALTGATVTSKAVVRAVNAAAAYSTGADVSSSATEWGD